jgi:catecholate siderophore receptor
MMVSDSNFDVLASSVPQTKAPGAKQSRGATNTLLATAIAAALPALALQAQTSPPPTISPATEEKTLKQVIVTETADAPLGKDAIRATTTSIGKGNQPLRDIPQSVTVVTEKLINERNLDTVKDVLHNTAGVTFLAAEGGEEDIRLRGFSLATTGDIYLDGMRDAAFYDRDTFNFDRLDLLRGSASMLFGRGSTGGVANQVSKAPHRVDDRSVSLTLGNYEYRRVTADINQRVAEDTAVRLTAMHTKANNNGAGSSIDKQGVAASIRHGIGESDEFQASIFYLDNNNGINYGLPWIRPVATDTSAGNTIIPRLKPEAYYGLASDYNAGKATVATASHIHRFANDTELKTQLRQGIYKRDLRASAIRFAPPPGTPPATPGVPSAPFATLSNLSDGTPLTRGTNLKIQDLDTTQVQSDLSSKFAALGMKHHLLAGIDIARDDRTVFAARGATQGGVTLVKPTTTIGTPNDGAAVDEATRVLRVGNDFVARAWGVYAQDSVEFAPTWKFIGGLRYDNLDGRYNNFAIPAAAPEPTTKTSYQQKISKLSHRVGVLFQPNELQSYHFSYGTSFNTSGDTYSYNALSANTAPESSINVELGAKLESANKQLSTRLALFHAVKKNERNLDPDTAATRLLLSGRRHSSGAEIDVAGRITKDWEVFLSYVWTPYARVDEAASTATTVGNRVGDRPGLSPKHSGAIWTTYQFAPKLRFGGGVNFRSRQAPADVTAPAWEAPSYATLDLFAEYKMNDRFTFKGNVVNATDKYYADSLYRGHYVPGAGRLVQANVVMSF